MKNLKELALKLAINYIDVSLRPDEEDVSFKKVLKKIIDRKLYPRSRNIAIIGAGASINANKNIYTAKTLAKVLSSKLINNVPEIQKLVDEELIRISNVSGLDGEAFETKLLALNKFFPKELLSLIHI